MINVHTRVHAHIERESLISKIQMYHGAKYNSFVKGIEAFDNLALWKSLFFSDNALM